MFALVSKNTKNAAGALWEVKCAKEEGVPVHGIYVSKTDRPSTLSTEFSAVQVLDWTWPNISAFLDSL